MEVAMILTCLMGLVLAASLAWFQQRRQQAHLVRGMRPVRRRASQPLEP